MTLKIVSLNLWLGGKLADSLQDFLAQEQADLMLLQEAYNGQGQIETRLKTVEQLKAIFPDYNHQFGPIFLDQREQEGEIQAGLLILSRLPLSEFRTVHFDVPYGKYQHDLMTDFSQFPAGMQIGAMTLDQRQIKLINVHGPVDLDGTADTKRRLNMRDKILPELDTKQAIIMSGDFNVRPQTQTIQAIRSQLHSVFDEELTTTFNIRRKDLVNSPGYQSAVVDMMFVSPEIKILSKSCPKVDVSDHLPLVVKLDLTGV